LQKAVHKAKIGQADKAQALKKLHEIAAKAEKDFIPTDKLQELIQKEVEESWKYGGKTIFGEAKPPKRSKGVQLRLF
jgi:predicted RNA-binding protein associated with RNAse of E/G family